MRHLRKDYDAIQPWPVKRPHWVKFDGQSVVLSPADTVGENDRPIIPDDEPVFLLRARDPAAIVAVLAWCEEAERLGSDPDLIEKVRRWASEMAFYGGKHAVVDLERYPQGIKPPDVPEGLLR